MVCLFLRVQHWPCTSRMSAFSSVTTVSFKDTEFHVGWPAPGRPSLPPAGPPTFTSLEFSLAGLSLLPRLRSVSLHRLAASLPGGGRLDAPRQAVEASVSSLAACSGLQALCLATGNLTGLPWHALLRLTGLTRLSMQNGVLTSLPLLSRMRCLRVLQLAGNELKVLPSEVGLMRAHRLATGDWLAVRAPPAPTQQQLAALPRICNLLAADTLISPPRHGKAPRAPSQSALVGACHSSCCMHACMRAGPCPKNRCRA